MSGPRHEARAALRGLATTMLGGLARVLSIASEGARLAARQLDLPAQEPDRETARPSSVRDAVDRLPDEPVRVSPPLFDDEPWDPPPEAEVTDRTEAWEPSPQGLVADPWDPAPDEFGARPGEPTTPTARLAPEGPGPVPVDVVDRAAAVDPVEPTEPGTVQDPFAPPAPLETDPKIAALGQRNVRELLAEIGALSAEELRALEVYERAHKNRKTVLAAIERVTFR